MGTIRQLPSGARKLVTVATNVKHHFVALAEGQTLGSGRRLLVVLLRRVKQEIAQRWHFES